MMIKPNLPEFPIRAAVASCEISPKIEFNLRNRGIDIISLTGRMNCDTAVKNHPDLYFVHCDKTELYYAKNICSTSGEMSCEYIGVDVILNSDYIKYPYDVFFNVVFVGNSVIGNKKYTHPKLIETAEKNDMTFINVNQGYTKCNISVVNEKSVITEDFGIAKELVRHGFDVLYLEHHGVGLKGYKNGFIGGSSGKISADKLAFFGDITLHPDFDTIRKFLFDRDIEPVSLSNEYLYDYGSLLPIF